MNRILWNDRDQNIDEVVIDHHLHLVHIEQMDDRCWWIGLYLVDDKGHSQRWSGFFSANSRGHMRFTEQDCEISWDLDEEHKKETAPAVRLVEIRDPS